jgi:SAM-dependent methyltransferase
VGRGGATAEGGRRHPWNHNIHYHDELLRLLPANPGRVLDVGSGDGLFARRLAGYVGRVGLVIALDIDPDQVRAARATCSDAANVTVLCGDVLSPDLSELAPGSFDAITSLAVLHHLPLPDALTRMARLLRPGGALLVLGLWPATSTLLDVAVSVLAAVVNRAYILRRGPGHMTAPAQEPVLPLRELRREVQLLLPGAVVRRRLLWRYVLVWRKPGVG